MSYRFSLPLRIICTTLSIVYLLAGCAFTQEQARPHAERNLQNPSRRLTITIQSFPPGAKVYGYRHGVAGKFLGTTPLSLQYTMVNYSTGIWGDAVSETISGSFASGGMYFNCVVIKEGSPPYSISELIAKTLYDFSGKSRTFTAILQPESPPSPIWTPSDRNIQQQQQQQQQTVIIPESGTKQSVEKGTVIVSASPDAADVLVDGIFVGNAPCKLSLTDGIHIIEVRSKGYNTFKREMRVMSGSEATIRATLQKE
jgi:hypothetical protein